MSALVLLGAALSGAAVGALHLAGLWWTVQRLERSRAPARLLVASFLARTALAAAALVVVGGGRLDRTGAALGGLAVARLVLVRRAGRRTADGPPREEGRGALP